MTLEALLSDETIERIAAESAAAANKHNDNDWFAEAEQIARSAAVTALHSVRDLLRAGGGAQA